jgi:hypothetical protein
MMQPFKGPRGQNMALCKCDTCAAETSVPADHGERLRGMKSHSTGFVREIQNEAQVVKKITPLGWAMVKGVLRCPKCEAGRKAPKEIAMPENVTDLRQPTREQNRLIDDMLKACYDMKAQRYTGCDTDKTVAEAIGGGVMPGWVSEVREKFFGPDNGNDELELLTQDIQAWQAKADEGAKKAHDALMRLTQQLREVNEARDQVAGLVKRLEAIKHAIGPKAARA